MEPILTDYSDVFEPELGLFKVPPAHLYVKEGVVPKFFKARPLPYATKDKVDVALDRLLASGVLSPVAHSEWATPISRLRKQTGTSGFVGITS